MTESERGDPEVLRDDGVDPASGERKTGSDPITVCLVTNDLEIGGVQRVVLDIVAGLDRRLFKPVIALVCGQGSHVTTAESLGVDVHYFSCVRRLGPFRLISVVEILRLSRFMARQKCSIVHTHLFFGNTFGRLAAFLAGVPVIIATEHNTYLDKPAWRQRVDRFLSKWTSALVTVTEAVADFIAAQEQIPRSAFTVIYNGIDASSFSGLDSGRDTARQQLGIPSNHHVIGTIGRLVPQKDMAFCLESFALFHKQYPDSTLLIVGDGPDRDALQQQAGAHGIQSAVFFTGHQLDIRPYLAAMDLVTLTPRYEGLGLVLLEAMAAGIPVSALAVGGIVEVIEHEQSGLLIEQRDPELVAASWRRLLNEPDLRQACIAEGRKRVETLFSRDVMVKRYEALYTGLLF